MSQELLNQILTGVAVPLVIALTGLLLSYIEKLKAAQDAKIKNEQFKKYLLIAEDAVADSVVAVMQTVVDKIKNTDAWTEEKQREVFEEAKLQALAIMGPATIEVMRTVYSDFEAWLKAKIESCVYSSKQMKLAPAALNTTV